MIYGSMPEITWTCGYSWQAQHWIALAVPGRNLSSQGHGPESENHETMGAV